MAVVDSYSESNQSTTNEVSVNIPGRGQSFTGDGSILGSALFYLSKSNSPTGNAVAKIYAHSGTFGTDGIPTGSALATSDNLDVSTLTGSLQLKTFTFSGANQITLTNGTKYFLTIEYSGGDGSNFVNVGIDATSPTHAGNGSTFQSGSWTAQSSTDYIFYVNSTGSSPSSSLSPSASRSPSSSASSSRSPSSSLSASLSPSGPPTSGTVLRVAKPGINALTNSDPEKMKFDSRFGTLKYFQKSTKQLTIVATGVGGDIAARDTVDHNLGYYPFVEVFVRVYIGSPAGNYEYVPFNGAGATVLYNANFRITSTQVVLYAEINGVSSSTWTFDFLVFIYKNNLNL